jgi:Tfp pilus assembly PilM family ATPase
MPFGLFRPTLSPILADFGASGVKLLQLSLAEGPRVFAAASIDFDEATRARSVETRLAVVAARLLDTLRTAGFRGRRVVVAPFTQHALVQHVAVPASDAACADELIRTRIAISLACDPTELIVRTAKVAETMRDGESRVETIAFGMMRQDVMRYVELFRRAGLTVVGVHSGIAAMAHAFDGDPLRADATRATMYADLGDGGTKIAICHGPQLVFAKSIPFAGHSLDAQLAAAHGGAVADARQGRMAAGLLAWRSPEPPELTAAPALAGVAPEPRPCPSTVAREAVEGLADELSMCMRYHGAFFPEHPIQRVVFVGGEARDRGLCQALAAALQLPAKIGDPLAALLGGAAPVGLPEPGAPHPGWTVACGLARTPTDL